MSYHTHHTRAGPWVSIPLWNALKRSRNDHAALLNRGAVVNRGCPQGLFRVSHGLTHKLSALWRKKMSCPHPRLRPRPPGHGKAIFRFFPGAGAR